MLRNNRKLYEKLMRKKALNMHPNALQLPLLAKDEKLLI